MKPMPRGRHAAALALVPIVAAVATGRIADAQARLPELIVEAPESLRAVGDQVRRLETERLGAVMRLVGLSVPGDPIRVAVVPEESRLARDLPAWVAAFADPGNDLIVLFPARIGSYPHDSLEMVLHHEAAHILTARAAGGGRLPRWFDEGLASVAERTWGVGNRTRFLRATFFTGQLTVTEIEGLFAGDAASVARAYIISHAIVRDVIRRHGASVVPRILSSVAAGATFDSAFLDATGTTARQAARIFWRSAGGWEEWITFVASPFTLWTAITTLALAAIWRHRLRRAERRREWEMEEAIERELDAWDRDDPPVRRLRSGPDA
ncbi:MAG: hypothetical protein F4Y45_02935 [Acidobacteria bacterium]|nr:hypothetical protein [Acidobacteriota bacterium]MYJ05827.1 hypothetical protein [Acidobacteriota bacterium]